MTFGARDMFEKLYHLVVLRKDKSTVHLTRYPMSHAHCRTVKSKFSAGTQASIVFVEARDLACVGVARNVRCRA